MKTDFARASTTGATTTGASTIGALTTACASQTALARLMVLPLSVSLVFGGTAPIAVAHAQTYSQARQAQPAFTQQQPVMQQQQYHISHDDAVFEDHRQRTRD